MSERIDVPLNGLLAAVSADGNPMAVVFREPLSEYAQALMDLLGVTVVIDPSAPEPAKKASGQVRKTRRDLTEDEREKLRNSYYARPDKAQYVPSSRQ